MRKRIGHRWVFLAAFGVLFAALFAIVGVAVGIGHPSVPSGDVAVVEGAPDGTISVADFQAALKRASVRQGLPKPPSPSSPQYATLRDAAMADVLLSRWIRGEAQERGITVSNTEVQSQLQQIIKQQFGGKKGFQKYIKQAGYTPAQARSEVELSLLTSQIQKEVLSGNTTVTSSQISNFYEANKAQFSQPETRDVRQIVNKDQAKVQQAKAQLEKDSSAKSWQKVAPKYSTDQTTNSNGGLRQGVTKDQSDPILGQQIFSAPQGTLTGPFKDNNSYYLIQVDKITPASTQPLSQVSSQIKQQLSQGVQQEVATNFQTDFIDKWTERSFCASGYVSDRCANFTPAVNNTSGAPPVTSSGAVDPGHATVFPGQTPQALPQGPQYPVAKQSGVIGPGGAPQLPPGAAPPTAPPPGG